MKKKKEKKKKNKKKKKEKKKKKLSLIIYNNKQETLYKGTSYKVVGRLLTKLLEKYILLLKMQKEMQHLFIC